MESIMPLNSEKLPKDVRNFLHELPLDRECLDDIYYQTKIEIYEKNCGDCGFAQIVLFTNSEDGRQKIKTFEGAGLIGKAVDFMSKNTCSIIRTCTYPNDLNIKNDAVQSPTLSEIVSNTCQFWHIGKLDIPPDEETAFIEVEELQIKVERMVDRRTVYIAEERISE